MQLKKRERFPPWKKSNYAYLISVFFSLSLLSSAWDSHWEQPLVYMVYGNDVLHDLLVAIMSLKKTEVDAMRKMQIFLELHQKTKSFDCDKHNTFPKNYFLHQLYMLKKQVSVWPNSWHDDSANDNSSNADWATFLASLLIERLY